MTHTVIIRYTTALLMLLALSVGAKADIYKCVINGVTAYSDAPCGIQAKKMNLSAGTPVQGDIRKPQSQDWLIGVVQLVWQFLNKTWYLILIFVAVSIVILKTPKAKGIFGEGVVNLLAKVMLDNDDYHLIKNVTLRTNDGTTQIDHVIVSRYGVFVIETKNMKGWIFGSPHQKTWTQKIYRHTSKFQNPLHQNYKHVKTLASLLGIREEKIYSVIAFVGESTFKTAMPENVTEGRGWIRFVKSRRHLMLPDAEVKRIIQEIEEGRLTRSLKTNREHVAHVKNIVAGKQHRST